MFKQHTAECVTAQESSARELCICGDTRQSKIDSAYYVGGVITIGATDHSPSFSSNTHRIVLQSETPETFVGWPDPTDKHNSDCWKPGIDKPLQYPKFAWELR